MFYLIIMENILYIDLFGIKVSRFDFFKDMI